MQMTPQLRTTLIEANIDELLYSTGLSLTYLHPDEGNRLLAISSAPDGEITDDIVWETIQFFGFENVEGDWQNS